jgi:hypothetical protein
MNAFWPLMRQSSPSATARVWIAPASDPACGSVRQYAPINWPDASRGSSLSLTSAEPY